METANRIINNVLGKKVTSVMPYFGKYDENTIHALVESNYEVIVSDSLSNKSVPNSIVKGDDQIIALDKTAFNSSEIDSKLSVNNIDYQLSTYKDDFDRVSFEGELFSLNIIQVFGLIEDIINYLTDYSVIYKIKEYGLQREKKSRNGGLLEIQLK